MQFKSLATRDRVPTPPRFTFSGETDSGTFYFAVTDHTQSAGMTTTSSDFVNFCVYNHEPGDLIVRLDILMDIRAKQTDNLIKKDESDMVLNQINEVNFHFPSGNLWIRQRVPFLLNLKAFE